MIENIIVNIYWNGIEIKEISSALKNLLTVSLQANLIKNSSNIISYIKNITVK